jgi:predicted NUDIX family NTP pyrophosphohydrolase
MFLCVWQDERLSGGKLITAWAYEEQLDVRYKGAYIEEPDFWSTTKDDSEQ